MLLCSLLTWACAFSPLPLQEPTPANGLHRLAAELTHRTAARRAAAEEAWKVYFPSFHKGDRDKSLQRLLLTAPEIQIPALQWIREQLASDRSTPPPVRSALTLLERVIDSAGAEALFELLPLLSSEDAPLALQICIQNGTKFLHKRAGRFLAGDDVVLARAALLSIVKNADLSTAVSSLADIPAAAVNLATADATLERLTNRPSDFQSFLPEPWLEDGFCTPIKLAQFWEVHPDSRSEDLLLNWFFNPNQSFATQLTFLKAIEANCAAFRWKKTTRKLSPLLREKKPGPIADELAWALHRLGEKNGDKFLLSGPKERVKLNPEDWRARLALMRIEVQLGVFKDAYKNALRSIDKLDGTRDMRRVTQQDWFYAARAAAGAHKAKQLEVWLLNAKLTPEQIKVARKLPEFERYLGKGAIGGLLTVR